MEDKVATRIAYVIVVVWTASIVLDAAWKEYAPPATIHALMMAVAGWAFGQRYLMRARTEAAARAEAALQPEPQPTAEVPAVVPPPTAPETPQ